MGLATLFIRGKIWLLTETWLQRGIVDLVSLVSLQSSLLSMK
jgi:hypothetical protein